MTRSQCIDTITKQLCLQHGLVWNSLPDKRKFELKTWATNIIATVERMQKDFSWSSAEVVGEP